MKKLLFGLVATVVFSLTGNAQKYLSIKEKEDYFKREIFNTFKQKEPLMFEKLKSNDLISINSDGKKVIYSYFENYFFSDNGELIILGNVDLKTNTSFYYNFNNQTKVLSKFTVNNEGKIITNEESFVFTNYDSSSVAKSAPCKDQKGFALCYTPVLTSSIFAGAGAPAVIITGTAYCYYAECVK